MRAPDIEGRAGRAWKVTRRPDDHIDTTATIAAYVMHAPGAHLAWSWYRLDVIHLRDIPGQSRPPTKKYPEAEFEFLILALDPDITPDPDDVYTCGHFLRGANVCEQFDGLSDEQAAELAKMAATLVCRGLTSPDSDFRSWWARAIPNTVKHIATGGHDHPKA